MSDNKDLGVSAEPAGLSAPTEPASSLGPSGFDPLRNGLALAIGRAVAEDSGRTFNTLWHGRFREQMHLCADAALTFLRTSGRAP